MSVTYTSGQITDEAWRCFWRDMDVYEKARLRLEMLDWAESSLYLAREVLGLNDLSAESGE